MAKKNISKSIRITQEVYDYVCKFPGIGFNDKFERLVMESMHQYPKLPSELIRLEDRINQRRVLLDILMEKSIMINVMCEDLKQVRVQLDGLAAVLRNALDGLDADVAKNIDIDEKEI